MTQWLRVLWPVGYAGKFAHILFFCHKSRMVMPQAGNLRQFVRGTWLEINGCTIADRTMQWLYQEFKIQPWICCAWLFLWFCMIVLMIVHGCYYGCAWLCACIKIQPDRSFTAERNLAPSSFLSLLHHLLQLGWAPFRANYAMDEVVISYRAAFALFWFDDTCVCFCDLLLLTISLTEMSGIGY